MIKMFVEFGKLKSISKTISDRDIKRILTFQNTEEQNIN